MINTGKFGEKLATEFLKEAGYEILSKNFRIRGGEIDIVALDKKVVVYVEVKTRTNSAFGLPEEAVTYHKLRFIKRAAEFYRLKCANLPESERIDVIAIEISGEKAKIKHLKNVSF